jgi:Leucine-rich repeat (LRR) protein
MSASFAKIVFIAKILLISSVAVACYDCRFGDEVCSCKRSYSGVEMECLAFSNSLITSPETFPSIANNLNKSVNYKTITIQNKNFETITSNASFGQSYSINVLQLQDNRIRWIERYAFSGIKNLNRLTLENNLITNLSFLLLTEMKTLEHLNIQNNSVAIIDQSWFMLANNLFDLYMSKNLLTSLAANSFSNLSKLKQLVLNHNNIETIQSNSFRNLKSLTLLTLNGNKIKILESFTMTDLISMSLYGLFELNNQNIQFIQPFAFLGLNKMGALTLASNSLTSLTNNSFTGMNNLRKLDLSNNWIDWIDTKSFTGLPALKYIDMSSNLLNSTQPNVFANFTNLETLILRANQIKIVHSGSFDEIGESLVNLDLSKNKLQFIKKFYFCNLSKMKVLDLASNSISSIEVKSFLNLRSLTILYLGDNCLFKISPQLFINQKILTQLYLDSNLLTNVEMIFFNLPNLTYLNLAKNLIYQLTNQTFKGLNSLVNLNLSSNFIKSLNRSLVSIKSLRSIDLSNNKIQNAQDQFNLDESVSTYEYFLRNTSIELIRNIKFNSSCKLDLGFNDLSREICNIPFKEMTDHLIQLGLRRTGFHGYAVNALNSLTKLIQIDLSDNLIKFNEVFLPNSTDLKSLQLSNVNISQSDFETFLNLSFYPSLSFVDLSFNCLETIKIDFFRNLCCLSYLNLSYNRIKSIEDGTFLQFSFLKIFDFTANHLESISKNFLSVVFLFDEMEILTSYNTIYFFDLKSDGMATKRTNLNNNHLRKIPTSFDTNILDMSFNFVLSINKNTFIYMTSLAKLDISSNLVETIENDSFLKQGKLFSLNLSNNRLSNLGSDTFRGLLSLEILNLNNNSIKFIQKGLLRDLSNLWQLYLDSNPIKFIEDESFKKQNYLKFLHLDSYDLNHGYILLNESSIVSNLTFVGLNNLRVLKLSKSVFSSVVSLIGVISNLYPLYDGTILNLSYYKSRHVVYENSNYNKWDCFLVLYVIRHKIQVNLYEDRTLKMFINFCGQYSLKQLSYLINSNSYNVSLVSERPLITGYVDGK